MRIRSRYKRLTVGALLALFGSLILSACGNSPAITNPQGPVAKAQSDLWWLILIISTFIFVIVTSVLLISVFRFRSRPGGAEARQIHGNTKIEIVWTAVPTAILFVILAVTVSTMFSLATPPSGQPTLNVTARGHQWWFEFDYPSERIVTADELVVPVGTVVNVSLYSDNVIHSFWIPQLAGKTDMIPGHDNKLWFKADVAGTYRGECAEYCGTQHAHMDFYVKAVSQADYAAFVSGAQGAPVTPVAGSPEASGQQVFKQAGCSGCHAIGAAPQGAVLIGPNLTHFGSRSYIAGAVLTNTPDNLKTWILHAQDVKPGADMPSFDGSAAPTYPQLSQAQVDDLVAYLESLK